MNKTVYFLISPMSSPPTKRAAADDQDEWVKRRRDMLKRTMVDVRKKMEDAVALFSESVDQAVSVLDEDERPLVIGEMLQLTRGEDRTDEEWLPYDNELTQRFLCVQACLAMEDRDIEVLLERKYRQNVLGIDDAPDFRRPDDDDEE